MKRHPRVVENLNQAMHDLLASEPRALLIGEDLLDPYGGAFKVTRGLSTSFPDRVLTTPISEGTIIGIAAGLALAGEKPVVEIMFGDFLALGFDQILNFASKSVTMYGRRLPIHLLIRCPVGGNRGYGPTHSQCVQKHFIGIPDLDLYELSPLHDNQALVPRLIDLGRPVILFEDKTLYPRRICRDGEIDDLFRFEPLGGASEIMRVFIPELDRPESVLIAAGGLLDRCLSAARDLLIEREIGVEILVPSRIHPLDPEPALERLAAARNVFIVEEGVAGGTWGAEVAQRIYERLWGRLRDRVRLIHSPSSIIPTAAHLERRVLVQARDICAAVAAVTPTEVAHV